MSNHINKLGDFVNIRTGKLDANASSEFGLYPFFTCSKEALKIDTYTYDCECVLVAGNGDLNVKYFKGKFDAYQRTYILETKDENKLDVRYLFYFLDTYLETLRTQSIGGVIKYIKLENLTNAPIPLPPLPIQKRIAEILDAADALRKKDQELLKKYDELAQAIFIDMFGDPVKNEKGWEVKRLFDVCKNIYGGGTPSKSKPEYYKGIIPWVTPKDMKSNIIIDSIDHINDDAINKSSTKLVPQNSVLMVIRSGILKHTLPVAINDKAVAMNQDMKAFIPNNKLTNSVFLLYFFRSTASYLLTKVRAVTADNIEFDQIKNMQFICPPIELQNKFSVRILNVQKQLEINLELNNTTQYLFNTLINKAFTGELVV